MQGGLQYSHPMPITGDVAGYVKVSVSDNGYNFAEIGEYLKIAGSIGVGMLSSKRGVMGIVESSYIDVDGTGLWTYLLSDASLGTWNRVLRSLLTKQD